MSPQGHVKVELTQYFLIFLLLNLLTDGIIQQQVDFAWLRRQRRASEQIAQWSKRTVLGLVVTGALGLLWLGLTEALGG